MFLVLQHPEILGCYENQCPFFPENCTYALLVQAWSSSLSLPITEWEHHEEETKSIEKK